MADKILTQQRLHELLHYDAETGFFTKKRFAVGSYQEGYLYICLDNKSYGAHRLAWLYRYGDIPKGLQIDHINGKRHDNRIVNLRAVTPQENLQNRGVKIIPSRLQLMLREKDMPKNICKNT